MYFVLIGLLLFIPRAAAVQWLPYLTLRAENAITVNWKTKTACRGTLLVNQPADSAAVRIREDHAAFVHRMTLKHLVPGMVYTYSIEDDTSPTDSTAPVSFKMPFQNAGLTFFVISDTHQVLPVPGLNEDVRENML